MKDSFYWIGKIKLTDFGLSKLLNHNINSILYNNSKAYTICGTPDYLSPEILLNQGYDKTIDWWSLGIIIYEMLVGVSPFKSFISEGKLDIDIYLRPVDIPKSISESFRSLISAFLQKDPSKRLGYGTKDATAVKEHIFFKDVDWDKILSKKISAPYIPKLKSQFMSILINRCHTMIIMTNLHIFIKRIISRYLNFTNVSAIKSFSFKLKLYFIFKMVENISENEMNGENEEEVNQNDSDDKDMYNDFTEGGWISWFCQLEGNEFFVEVDEAFIRNPMNLYGFQNSIQNYKTFVEIILSPDSPSDNILQSEEYVLY